MQLVILAAGMGRRFGGPKQLASVGPNGEAIIDYTAADAIRAGFSGITLVVRPEIAREMAEHVERQWPAGIDVRIVEQDRGRCAAARVGVEPALLADRRKPLGTGAAVLAASGHAGASFGVANADDLYGPSALAVLRRHLTASAGGGEHALVAYRLGRSFSGPGPVSRAICTLDGNGGLHSLRETSVRRTPAGELVADGSNGGGRRLEAGSLVSMNLWGLHASIFSRLDAELCDFLESGRAATGAELLLPEVVSAMVEAGSAKVRVLVSEERCVGITHPDDVGTVRREVVGTVARGESPWGEASSRSRL